MKQLLYRLFDHACLDQDEAREVLIFMSHGEFDETHGVKFTMDTDVMKRSLDACRFAYLHAQFFNPALKIVAPVRKALGVRTFFNMLGPLVNPALPRR